MFYNPKNNNFFLGKRKGEWGKRSHDALEIFVHNYSMIGFEWHDFKSFK